MTIAIIDYGMGNMASVLGALKHIGHPGYVAETPADLAEASHIILPGVGSFALAMKNLNAGGWTDEIHVQVHQHGTPFLGICLGMQLLGSNSTEHGDTKGLDLVPGSIRHFSKTAAAEAGLRVPHVGWNEITPTQDHPFLDGVEDGTDFYFVHSYVYDAIPEENVVARTPYGFDFASVIANGPVWGAQFHPEKSSLAGFRLLKNFVELA